MDKNKYNSALVALVQVCHAEMLFRAEELGITEMDFTTLPNVKLLSATFEDDDNHFEHLEIGRITFDFKERHINVFSKDGRYKAYLDGYWGDYFDVGSSFCKVYQMFTEYINASKIQKHEQIRTL